MKKTSSTPNLPSSSRMQMAAGGDKMAPMAKKAGKAGATTKMMKGASKKAMPAKKGY
jgi:hypothetical protein